MKRLFAVLLMGILLAGCGETPVMETVADELLVPVAADPARILVELPPEAAAAALELENQEFYQCQGYELMLQTLPSGDLDATVRQVSGFPEEKLTILKTDPDLWKRYDLVWSAMAQEGELVGRAAILDDGNYHYVLTVLAPADTVVQLEETWGEIFQSFSLEPY